jgi:hypothetical protein
LKETAPRAFFGKRSQGKGGHSWICAVANSLSQLVDILLPEIRNLRI